MDATLSTSSSGAGRASRGPSIVALAAVGLLGVGVMLLFLRAPWLIFYRAPVERTLGFSQKIFYFHVGCAWSMFLAVGVAGVGAVQFLRTRARRWDDVTAAGAALVQVFGTAVLTSGPIWGKLAWGTYWVWDARLTSTLLLYLTFIAYGLLRRFGGPGADRLGAGLALFGTGVSPFIFFAVNLWRTQHPKNTVAASLPHDMAVAFWTSVAAFVGLFVLLAIARIQAGRAASQVEELTQRAIDLGLYDEDDAREKGVA